MTEQDDWRSTLRDEFDAADGSFLMRLRVEMTWDPAAFDRLTSAMARCCEALAGSQLLDRWIANGFWHISWFPLNWTNHPSWLSRPDRSVIEDGTRRLDELAYWFFHGYKMTLG